MHKIYAQRRQGLLNAIEKYLSPWMQPVSCLAGLHTSAFLTSDLCVNTLVNQAAAKGVKIECLTPFYDSEPGKSGLVFGYGVISSEQIEPGLAYLRQLAIKT